MGSERLIRARLTKFDVLPIRFLLSVLSLRLGDFVRLEPDGKVAMQVGDTG